MKAKAIVQSIILQSLMVVIFTVMAVPMAVSEMVLNDNVNIEGELFLDGESSGITFSDGTSQATAATPSWHQILYGNERFELVMNNQAVLDRETGLVWQINTNDTTYDWYAAQSYCYTIIIGGRKGWCLPTIEELATLVEPSEIEPALPERHPFTNVKEDVYWSSTTYSNSTSESFAWHVNFVDGGIGWYFKTSSYYVRAVRRGQ